MEVIWRFGGVSRAGVRTPRGRYRQCLPGEAPGTIHAQPLAKFHQPISYVSLRA
jgi:hypothetical protein